MRTLWKVQVTSSPFVLKANKLTLILVVLPMPQLILGLSAQKITPVPIYSPWSSRIQHISPQFWWFWKQLLHTAVLPIIQLLESLLVIKTIQITLVLIYSPCFCWFKSTDWNFWTSGSVGFDGNPIHHGSAAGTAAGSPIYFANAVY